MASQYFARGDDTRSAAEIRAGAALLKLEAGRYDATNKSAPEYVAKHLDEVAAGVAMECQVPRKRGTTLLSALTLALARHYHEMAKSSAAQKEHEQTGYSLEGAALACKIPGRRVKRESAC